MDGELVCRVLQLMNLTDARLSQVIQIYLDNYSNFFIQWRAIQTALLAVYEVN